ncbi:MAG: hypothetical protein ABIN95_14355 [Mucilaginibacter sp.]
MKKHIVTCGFVVALLAIQSCKKETSIKSDSGTNGNKKVTATDAYQDNTITNWFKRNSASMGSIAFDQAASVPLTNGKVLWLLGDTYWGPTQQHTNGKMDCIYIKFNTVLQQPTTSNWTTASTINLTYAGEPQIFQHLTPATKLYWPSAGIQIGNKVYCFLTEMQRSPLAYTGGAVGALDLTTNGVGYTLLGGLNGINFGNGMIKGTDGYIYIYGNKQKANWTNDIYLARCLQTNPAAWSYYKGTIGGNVATASNWSTTVSTAVPIFNAVSSGVNVAKISTKYVLTNTAFTFGCENIRAIYGSTSTNLTGPFAYGAQPRKVIYNIPDTKVGVAPNFYTPIVHPHLTANSEFLMTYCINTWNPCVSSCINNEAIPDDYRPRAVRVPFSVLGL